MLRSIPEYWTANLKDVILNFMSEIVVSLPKPLKDWAEAQAASGKYASTGDFVRDLLSYEQDQRRKLSLLQTEIDRGLSAPETDATIETIIAESRAGIA